MNTETRESSEKQWLSTYGLLTAARILESYKIRLRESEVFAALHDEQSLYYKLLQIPLKNIYSEIILQQAHDLQVFAEKLFIDYLLAGQHDKGPEAPGASIREDLEKQRKEMISLAELREEHERALQLLIGESQSELMRICRKLPINAEDLEAVLAEFLPRALDLMGKLKQSRINFSDLIIKANHLFEILPDYYVNQERAKENMAHLDFDRNLGEN